jgi:hypothetical protein
VKSKQLSKIYNLESLDFFLSSAMAFFDRHVAQKRHSIILFIIPLFFSFTSRFEFSSSVWRSAHNLMINFSIFAQTAIKIEVN